MYMGFAVGVLGEKFFSNPGCMVAAGVTVAAAVASGLLYYLVCSMVWGNISLFTGVVRIVLPQALYSGFAALLLFSLIRAAMRMLNMRILA